MCVLDQLRPGVRGDERTRNTNWGAERIFLRVVETISGETMATRRLSVGVRWYCSQLAAEEDAEQYQGINTCSYADAVAARMAKVMVVGTLLGWSEDEEAWN